MKKRLIALSAVICILLTGCSGVSQEEYNALESANSELQSRVDEMTINNDALLKERDSLNSKYDELEGAYEQLKKEAEPFMKLSEDEKAAEIARAEKDRIEAEIAAKEAQKEADRLEEEQKAQEEAERLAEEEARLAEEAKGYETGITFNDISRTPDKYTGKKVKFTGMILQVVEDSSLNSGRMSTKGKYDDVIYFAYDPNIIDVRLLEDDMITIYGTFSQLFTYQTVLGNNVTLPLIIVDRIEMN